MLHRLRSASSVLRCVGDPVALCLRRMLHWFRSASGGSRCFLRVLRCRSCCAASMPFWRVAIVLHCLRFWFWKCLEALAALLRASGAVGRFVGRVVRRSCCTAFYALLARCVHFPGICILSLPSYCVGDPLALCLRRMLHRLRSASSVLRCVGDPVALWPPANASLVPICVQRSTLEASGGSRARKNHIFSRSGIRTPVIHS